MTAMAAAVDGGGGRGGTTMGAGDGDEEQGSVGRRGETAENLQSVGLYTRALVPVRGTNRD